MMAIRWCVFLGALSSSRHEQWIPVAILSRAHAYELTFRGWKTHLGVSGMHGGCAFCLLLVCPVLIFSPFFSVPAKSPPSAALAVGPRYRAVLMIRIEPSADV